ncbi:MAG: SDR family oxidoreductase [Verrucomicrobia bacterium]|nr:SDR family oxidoreductase [Verrucomicrobiota bacterium]MBU6446197.1 SDR family oxidoreductase [Verrucomicrobiota bacterium]MDE3047992.1 SDR family oxidoreductase [Verrucomicrobiota bacterium]
MDLKLSGKRALVTGASQGMGKACAMELALLGCQVVIVARGEQKLSQTVAELEKLSPQGHSYLVVDLSDRKSVEQIKGGFDILVNNSGGPPGGLIAEAKEEDFEAAFHKHLFPYIAITQKCIPDMKKKKFGRIINIISSSVKQPIPFLGVSNTVRWSVAAWAKTLAGELGPFGITVNSVLPGSIHTDRLQQNMEAEAARRHISFEEVVAERIKTIPAGRIGEPREFGAVVAFLATPAASFVNGVALCVDGGQTTCL